ASYPGGAARPAQGELRGLSERAVAERRRKRTRCERICVSSGSGGALRRAVGRLASRRRSRVAAVAGEALAVARRGWRATTGRATHHLAAPRGPEPLDTRVRRSRVPVVVGRADRRTGRLE